MIQILEWTTSIFTIFWRHKWKILSSTMKDWFHLIKNTIQNLVMWNFIGTVNWVWLISLQKMLENGISLIAIQFPLKPSSWTWWSKSYRCSNTNEVFTNKRIRKTPKVYESKFQTRADVVHYENQNWSYREEQKGKGGFLNQCYQRLESAQLEQKSLENLFSRRWKKKETLNSRERISRKQKNFTQKPLYWTKDRGHFGRIVLFVETPWKSTKKQFRIVNRRSVWIQNAQNHLFKKAMH